MSNKYKKTYLTSVIIRIDLASPISEIEKGLPKNITKNILKFFPISEPQKVTEGSIKFESAAIQTGPTRLLTIWNFYGKEREKTLSVAEQNLFIEYRTYKSFENLKEEFLSVLNAYLKDFPDAQINRLGLRYVNNIEIYESNPTDWHEYISGDLLSSFKITSNEEKLTRNFHILGAVKDECNLTFQFGMHNPDYPAPIKKKVFILDFDSYFQGEQEISGIEKNIELSHELIQKYFEKSITQKLRLKMNK
ncbi:MAG TPA: TIGR04255 family protein [Candidatus Limnocylindrales bacterium]|nr:TIGR04255 family protein [Candidatus Limnocylindrales bacterium]